MLVTTTRVLSRELITGWTVVVPETNSGQEAATQA